MRKSLGIFVFALVGVLWMGGSAHAAITDNEKKAVVRIEVRTATGVLKSSGAGVMVDIRGRVLTNRHVIASFLTGDQYVISLCVSQDDGLSPTCLMRAKVLESREDPSDVALLQVTEVQDKKLGWMTLDEYRLRYGNPSFLKFVKLDKTVTVREPLALGDKLSFLGYHNSATDTVTYAEGIMSGIQKSMYNKTTLVHWYVKTDVDVNIPGTGGAAFDKDNNFIGIPTKTFSKVGYILARPVLNRFLVETLGKEYASTTADTLAPNSSVGVFGGALQTKKGCPSFSTLGAANTGCWCDAGFFAVGDSCIVATTYCKIKGGTYPYFGQACEGVPEIVLKPVVTTPTTTLVIVKPAATTTKAVTTATSATIDQTNDAFVKSQIATLKATNTSLMNRLRGMILLQTQNHGEAWYLDPVTSKRHYMKDGATAYQMLRAFGLGVTNDDLAKIKAVDGTLADKMKGRIVLQVQSHGEAYYIHPISGTAYYLKDGDAAYKVMREVSLGVSNADLQTLPIAVFVPKK